MSGSTAVPPCSRCSSRSHLIWIVACAVIRPLRKLTESAVEMSQKQLPQLVESMRAGGEVDTFVLPPIEINSSDETGELARLRVQRHRSGDRAGRDRAGQAVPQGHRRPVREPGPPQPGPARPPARVPRPARARRARPAALEDLFKLDHMATRMRRNARASSSCRAPSRPAGGGARAPSMSSARPRPDRRLPPDRPPGPRRRARRPGAPSPTSRTSSPSSSRTLRVFAARHPALESGATAERGLRPVDHRPRHRHAARPDRRRQRPAGPPAARRSRALPFARLPRGGVACGPPRHHRRAPARRPHRAGRAGQPAGGDPRSARPRPKRHRRCSPPAPCA